MYSSYIQCKRCRQECSYSIIHGIRIDKSETGISLNNNSKFLTSSHSFKGSILIVKSFDFDKNKDELCVYKKVQGSTMVFMVLYVDDILLIGNDVRLLSLIKI